MKPAYLVLPVIIITAIFAFKTTKDEPRVTPISAELRESFKLGDFYKKTIILEGFPILASEKTPDAALYEAAYVINRMLKNRPDILRELGKNKIRYSIMAVDERTCDIPEHSDLAPPAYWNRRARGLGASPQRPSVSCGEENLLANEGDPYFSESICIHEFAHAIHDTALKTIDSTFDDRLKEAYQSAMARGLWAGKYAATNRQEYWAEAVQSWFGTNRENDPSHNHVNTRVELVAYDPAVAQLCAEVFGENDWVYQRPDHPSRLNDPHLKDLDRSTLKPFAWTAEEQAAFDALPPRQ